MADVSTGLAKSFIQPMAEHQSTSELDARGISVIHQEMSLIDSMSVVDNIFLGRELTRGRTARQWTDRSAEIAKAKEFCAELDLDIDLSRPVEDYSLSVKNRIEIAKALVFDARIFIMDEPTSALSGPEVERLFALVRQLKARGCGVIYITHRMEEIYRIADRMIRLMIGRELREKLGGKGNVVELKGLMTSTPGQDRNSGHFALEDKGDEIGALMHDFLDRKLPRAPR